MTKKRKHISNLWILTTVRLADGLKESFLDHSATMYCTYNMTIYLYMYFLLPVLIRLKLQNPMLRYPWVCTIITLSPALSLGLHYNDYVSQPIHGQ